MQEIRQGYKQTEVGVIPEDWEVAAISKIAMKITDGEHVTPIRTKTGYFLLSARNVLDGAIDLSDVDYVGHGEYSRIRLRCDPSPGDILISCSGTIGRVALVPDALECVLVRSAALAKLDSKKVDSRFVHFWLRAAFSQKQISNSVNQGAQPNLFLNHIERLLCVVPPLPEQRAIAAALADADALIAALEGMIAKKRDVKQAAMQHLLTGKTRLPGFSGEWEVKRLGDVANIRTGKRNNQDKQEDGAFPFFVRSETVERINSFSHDCEAILIPGEGNIGSIFHYIVGKFDVHQRVYAITNFIAGVSGKYVHLWMRMNFGAHAMQNTVKATVDSLRLPTFQIFELMFPPTFEEQVAIAEVLSDMDAGLAALEEQAAKARAVKQGMMQELLTGKTRLI